MTPEQQTALDLQSQGYSRAQIAAQMGISEHAVKRRLAGARKWMDADPAATHAAQVAGSNAIPHSFWVKTDSHSIYYQTPKDDAARDVLAEIADAFRDIPQYVSAPAQLTRGNLMTVYPLMDAHFGMRAWGKETGDVDYDLAYAERDLKQAFANLWVDTPDSDTAVLILGGDTLHADDNRAETPASGHKLDVDGRQYKAAEVAIRALAWVIEGLERKHRRVIVRVLRGNHDPHAHMILHFALSARYAGSRVTVESAERDLYWIRWGRSLVASHHGDKGAAQRLAMYLADTCPEWSATRDRHILTGHIHHDSIKDFPGVKWWSLRAFCPPDEYGAAFGGRRALQSLTFDDKTGLRMHLIEGIYRNG
jgi:hypothetical protein